MVKINCILHVNKEFNPIHRTCFKMYMFKMTFVYSDVCSVLCPRATRVRGLNILNTLHYNIIIIIIYSINFISL